MSLSPNLSAAGPKHERSDVDARVVAIALFAVICIVVVVAFVVKAFLAASAPSRAGPTDTPIAAPVRLGSDPAGEIAAYQEEKLRQLDGYGWVDRDRGIAHVPIARAVQMMAEQEHGGSP